MALRMELTGKVALVTGAARGLGRAMALALADAGCDVAVSDIACSADGATPYALASSDDLAGSARAVEQRGRRSVAIPADVTVAADVARLMETVAQRLGGLDILVANAGIIAAAPVAVMDEAQWDRIFAVNVKGVFLCARAAIPLLAGRGSGRIVNVASVAGLAGAPYLSAYSAAKHGVVGLTRALAQELAKNGITVNAVCPGYVETALTDRSIANIVEKTGMTPEDARATLAARSPQKRMMTPSEVAELVAYLVSDEARGVNGQAIVLDGGGLVA